MRWQSTLITGMLFSCGRGLAGEEGIPLRSLQPPVLMPDGAEFKTWESPRQPKYSHTYHVDGKAAHASDKNPGTRQKPFKTINHAAQLLQSGERVVVASGVYRERVAPAHSGAGPDRMIAYVRKKGPRLSSRALA